MFNKNYKASQTFLDLWNKEALIKEIIDYTGEFLPEYWSLDAGMDKEFEQHLKDGKDPAEFYYDNWQYVYQSCWNAATNDERSKYEAIADFAISEGLNSVLDYGCNIGSGVITCGLAGLYSVMGADICRPAIKFLNERIAKSGYSNMKTVDLRGLSDLAIDSIMDGKEYIVCTEVLEHVSDPIELIKNIRDWLIPRGYITISWSFVPMTAHLPQHFHLNTPHPDKLLTEGFGKVVLETGFEYIGNFWFNNYTFRKTL